MTHIDHYIISVPYWNDLVLFFKLWKKT